MYVTYSTISIKDKLKQSNFKRCLSKRQAGGGRESKDIGGDKSTLMMRSDLEYCLLGT